MSKIVDLDFLRDALEKEYAPVTVPLSDGSEAVLRNVLRLPKKVRDEVLGILEELETLQDESGSAGISKMSDVLFRLLEKVADGNKGRKLVADLGDDVLLAMKVVEQWQEATQPGEAENSPA